MRNVQADQTLSTFGCATRQFACAHGVLGFHEYGFCFGLPKDCDGNTGIVVSVDRLSEMDHLAAVPDSIDGKSTDMLLPILCFFNTGCRRQSSLIATLASQANYGLPSSRCLARDWTCLQRIIRRPMVKLSDLIVSSAMFFALSVLSHLRLGSRCSLSLILR